MDRTIGFIGAGNMAEALLRGVFAAGVLRPTQCTVTNKSNDKRLARLARALAVRTTRDKARLMAESEVIILAVKPHDMPAVLSEIGPYATARHLIVSVAAGVPCEAIERCLGASPVVRAMPNTSTAVRASATAIASGRLAGPDHLAIVRTLFEAVGWVGVVPESMLDAVTAVSGSGPAYIYMLAEALVDSGEQAGLPRDLARALVGERVTSPGGTTMAGLEALEQGGLRAAVRAAVTRAARRARELRSAPARTPR
ncbi:MAG: pyrroline-5-carboxylate reductase [Bacillati bacterium ANGP1]|uniref:Pyrroline-5-carboxylate reductase n=1 Tax=Candidatus Segetimicrobium genomatis TaxID=2569760 RepID=A0A537JFE9_9BACT|nr:MAG: pyrroline-5-carboxylate reductase [Terrabacteria group bacterium ANGP1]